MGEFFLELIFDFATELIFSPPFSEKWPRPIRIIFSILSALLKLALFGLIIFAGIFALIKYFKEGGSVLILIGGLILLSAVVGLLFFTVFKIHKTSKE